tara:strand:+ start:299 stop:691 length:393 start_codon:yes stop_codon:yes gene_type:complete
VNNNRNKSILIVENDVRILESLQGKLKSTGYVVISSKEGYEGFQRAKKEMPDLILIEDNLPVMSGLKICRILKFDERYKHLKIIIMGSKATLEGISKDDYGFDGIITKPFRIGDLRELINQQIELANHAN